MRTGFLAGFWLLSALLAGLSSDLGLTAGGGAAFGLAGFAAVALGLEDVLGLDGASGLTFGVALALAGAAVFAGVTAFTAAGLRVRVALAGVDISAVLASIAGAAETAANSGFW